MMKSAVRDLNKGGETPGVARREAWNVVTEVKYARPSRDIAEQRQVPSCS